MFAVKIDDLLHGNSPSSSFRNLRFAHGAGPRNVFGIHFVLPTSVSATEANSPFFSFSMAR